MSNLNEYRVPFPDVPPPGCERGWPVRLKAQSGIHVVYGRPHSRQPPGVAEVRGIGIKMQNSMVHQVDWHENNTRYQGQHRDAWRTYTDQNEHDSSWAGLYDQKLHELYFPFGTSNVLSPNRKSPDKRTMLLHLPMMGMPPREPTAVMMEQAKSGNFWSQSSWFRYAYVIKATDLRDAYRPNQYINVEIGQRYPNAWEDVVIKLPAWPNPQGHYSLYTRTERRYGFEFRTAYPLCEGPPADPQRMCRFENLYFIQLLQNELPSYHFWADTNISQTRALPQNRNNPEAIRTRVRMYPDARGSPHHTDDSARISGPLYAYSVTVQKLRSQASPQYQSGRLTRAGNSPTKRSIPRKHMYGSKSGTKFDVRKKSYEGSGGGIGSGGASDSGTGGGSGSSQKTSTANKSEYKRIGAPKAKKNGSSKR